MKLYAITRGNLSHIEVNSNIVEIAQIAEGVQILLNGIDQSVPKVSLAELSNRTTRIRSIAKESNALDMSSKDFLIHLSNEIEEVVKELSFVKHKKEESGII